MWPFKQLVDRAESETLFICIYLQLINYFGKFICLEHMCSSSGGQDCITQSLVSSHL